MATDGNPYLLSRSDERGQGVVEAIVSLPVFLLLISFIFQLFFLAIAQIQLQYAAFYAARVGAVHNGSKEKMESAVSRILENSFSLAQLKFDSYRIEILRPENQKTDGNNTDADIENIISVKVHWKYPLLIPFAHNFISRSSIQLPGRTLPAVDLKASWSMPLYNQSPSQPVQPSQPTQPSQLTQKVKYHDRV